MRALLFVSCCWLLAACAAPRRAERFYQKNLRREILSSPVFAHSFTGFVLRDAATGRTLCEINGDKNFTPASNLKILTLATCLEVLGDSLPGLEYILIYDEPSSGAIMPYGLCFRGTGDPTFLHPQFEAWQPAARLLQTGGALWFEDRPAGTRFGPGWAWDDFGEYYSAERSALPIHGNFVRLKKSTSPCEVEWSAYPDFFSAFLNSRPEYDLGGRFVVRDEASDTLWTPFFKNNNIPPGFETDIPVWQAGQKTAPLLKNLLGVEATTLQGSACGNGYETLYSAPLDTVLRRMMYQSDNFIAEQMLLLCAGAKFGVLQQDTIIQWAKDSLFGPRNFPISNFQFPTAGIRWVDGSGLSRYNLVSPRYLTDALLGLWQEQPRERLFSLFPTAGAPETTLDWWQPAPARPWLYAKTGSMSGVQCISGYVVTRRGKVLIFSFMHNNFTGSGRPWRAEMRRILEKIHDR